MRNLSKAGIVILFFLTLYAVNFRTINAQIQFAQSDQLFSEESRVLHRTLRHQDAKLFQNDYITNYLDSGPQIIGYQYIQRIFSSFGDLRTGLHRYMHFPLWILIIGSIVLSVWRIAGWQIAWASGCISISSALFFHQMVGATPHAFAFPILACMVLINVFGKPTALLPFIILSGLLYPPMIPIIGINLTAYLFLLEPRLQGSSKEWSFKRKVAFLGTSGVIAVALLLPFLKPIIGFGEPVVASGAFPEAGEGGRPFPGILNPLIFGTIRFIDQYNENLSQNTRLLIMTISVLIMSIGFLLRDRKNIYFKRLLPFFFASAISFLVVYFIAPSFLYRYYIYPAPLVAFILLPISFYFIFNRINVAKNASPTIALLLSLAYSFLMSATDPKQTGYHYQIPKSHLAAYDFIESLDKNLLIAGFPGQTSLLGNGRLKISIIEYVPYLAKRKAYLTHKLHYPNYKDYTLVLRKRMDNVIQIFSTESLDDLLKFRDEEEVRYLIVEPEYLKSMPKYFKPFDHIIEKRWESVDMAQLQVIKQKKSAVVFENRGIYILDLDKVAK